MARKISRLRNNIERKPAVFIATCSVQQMCGDGEHEFDGKTVAAVEREMIAAGWLDDFIIEDSLNLACPACVQYCKENASEFDELDERAGGKAK